MKQHRPIGLAIALGCGVSCADPVRPDLTTTVASVEILAAQTWLSLQQSLQLSAALTDSAGDTLHQIPVTWSSSHPDVAAVDPHGLLVGFRSGLTRVFATVGAVSDTLVFSVDADGPASEATWTCPDSFIPRPPMARRLAFEVEATGTVPLVSIDDFLAPLLVDRGASIIHQYQNFPRVRVMLDRDSIASLRAAYLQATARTGPFLRGVASPDESPGTIIILFTGDPVPITAEILRLGGQVKQILSITPIIIAEVPDFAVPYVQAVAGVVGEVEYDYSGCLGI